MEILHSDLSKETGREEKGKSRDLSNGSLKTGRHRAENLHSNLFKRREGEREKEQEQRSE